MAVNNLVTGPNLNPDDFNLGTDIANRVTVNVDGSTIVRAAGGFNSPDQLLSYSNATQELTLSRNDGSPPIVLDLSALAADIFVDGASFDGTTGVLTLTDNDAGTPDVTINLAALLGVSTDAGNLLANGSDGKPLFTAAVLCQAVTDNCVDDCPLTDLFGNSFGTVLQAQ